MRSIIGAAVVAAALGFIFTARPPGAAIRGDLSSGADALRALPANASPARVTAAVRSAMRGRMVQVDPSGFPAAIAVTIRDLDWRSCIAAEHSARRLEGQVVIELQAYGSANDCHESNAMTWRFMP